MLLLVTGVSGTLARPGCKAPGFEGSSQAQEELLFEQNQLRSKTGLPPLVWSNELAEAAQQWADKLLVEGLFMHSDMAYGENLYKITGCATTAAHVVTVWTTELQNYNYRENTCSGECGHYTQIVWRETRKVGCGVARSSNQEIWACEYDPPGNVIGEWPY